MNHKGKEENQPEVQGGFAREIKERYDGLDILKLLCAFFVVCIHQPFAWDNPFTVVTRCAVPIFFMISGFFYNLEDVDIEKAQIKKVICLVIGSNLLYFIWNLFLALLSGDWNSMKNLLHIKVWITMLLTNESPLAGHLWYLGALLYVLLILRFCGHFHKLKALILVSPLLLFIDLIFGKYSLLIWGREYSYFYVRNFLFVGIPYFCIGIWLKNRKYFLWAKEVKHKGLYRVLLVGGGISFVLTSVLERYFLIQLHANATRDHYISTTLLSLCLFLLFCDNSVEWKRSRILANIGRKYTTFIYVFHPIVITVLGIITTKLEISHLYGYLAPVIVFLVTALVARVLKVFDFRKVFCSSKI